MKVAELVFASLVCAGFLGILATPDKSEAQLGWYASVAIFGLVLAILTIVYVT